MTNTEPMVLDVREVVFDLDGVLVDTESINLRSAFETFRAFGHPLDPEDAAVIVGRHPVDYVPLFADRCGLSAEQRVALRNHQGEIFRRLWQEEARPIDGAREALDGLRRRGYRIALATSGGRFHVRHCLDRFELKPFFEFVLTKDDVRRRKPDPEVYLTSARRFGIEPGRMLAVEDSEHGVSAAKAAGARCVAIRTEHVARERVDRADLVLDSLAELAEVLPGNGE